MFNIRFSTSSLFSSSDLGLSVMEPDQSQKRYFESVGEIAVLWNYLERDLHVLGFQYLKGDSDVAGQIFGALRNVEKAEFVKYLASKYETNTGVIEHVNHFILGFDRIRENRNIIEHSVPTTPLHREYTGQIAKVSKKGIANLFSAPIDQMISLIEAMRDYRRYCLLISVAAGSSDDEPNIKDALASIDKPLLPNKIGTLPLPEDRADG